MKKITNLPEVGDVVNSWTIQGVVLKGNKHGSTYLEAQCVCGNLRTVYYHHITTGKSTKCNPCSRKGVGDMRVKHDLNATIPSWLYSRIQSKSQKRGISFNVSQGYLSDLYDTQEGLCALTNVILRLTRKESSETTASLDRIDSSKGYEIGNVQWVHKTINKMKLDHNQYDFINWCRLVERATRDR